MTLYTLQGKVPELAPDTYTAPSAQIIGDVHIGAQSSVWFQTVIRGDTATIRIGERTNIQDMSVCHVDEGIPLTIGDGVTVGHRCIVHGCTIEDHCLIGMGAIIMNHAVIGTGSVVAADALILEKTIIPPYSLVTGSPGKIKKTYDDREAILEQIKRPSDIYVNNGQLFGNDALFHEIKS